MATIVAFVVFIGVGLAFAVGASSRKAADMGAYYRHPIHPNRCACRMYGLPGGIHGVRDYDALHTAIRCAPEGEL